MAMKSPDDLRTREKAAALRKTLFFSAASEADLRPILMRAREVRLKKGEVLFTAGQASRGMYVVLQGRTCASRLGPDGREQIIHEDGAGATFAEVTVFSERACQS
jgi:CRP/FNR family transcriptional regulator